MKCCSLETIFRFQRLSDTLLRSLSFFVCDQLPGSFVSLDSDCGQTAKKKIKACPEEVAKAGDGGLSPMLGSQSPRASKRDSLRRQFKRELVLTASMEAIVEQKSQEELSEAPEEGDTPVKSEGGAGNSAKEDTTSSSPSGAEIEAEFLLLARGFQCDLAALDRRLQQEETSRDQAEDSIKEEVSGCQALLQTLVPLCENNAQTMELIKRLQKNLDILPLSMMRMSSRSETLGAIQQEKRASQAVDGMIQHVEHLRRMYSTEHTELSELKQSLIQGEGSINSENERDEFGNQNAAGSQFYSVSPLLWSQGDGEVDMDRLTRRSSWKGTGQNAARPALHRFISTCAWMETNDSSLMKRYEETDAQPQGEKTAEVQKKSKMSDFGNKIRTLIVAVKTQDHPVPRLVRKLPMMLRDRSTWEWWTPLVLAVLLGSLLGLLGTLTQTTP
ncbi:hypothetical protein AGOR_G00247260 [Albula goreensis]|uniref:Lymphoid-restricted membrane protein n=1 Tax=Albula goreensis TaxID=1534307 RepID=A0A8T3CHD7_9TELE|nr:hypothetical protein AGOR_G00247260 [Albula goreensis]